MEYEKYGQGHTLFEIGDDAHKFYFILKGKVDVFIKKETTDANPSSEMKQVATLLAG